MPVEKYRLKRNKEARVKDYFVLEKREKTTDKQKQYQTRLKKLRRR